MAAASSSGAGSGGGQGGAQQAAGALLAAIQKPKKKKQSGITAAKKRWGRIGQGKILIEGPRLRRVCLESNQQAGNQNRSNTLDYRDQSTKPVRRQQITFP